ncbi:prolyl oligopeptidase family serine peptidase [Pleionea sediminis]|uniref:prolyl oligopeptidase family serine peptidase n=1 Tax=Pleionea sediminis TaxID=2569479 RepID=UPI001186F891|nr:prolyl oligopeptidase family serine peptidase [Pleionea sediminis]
MKFITGFLILCVSIGTAAKVIPVNELFLSPSASSYLLNDAGNLIVGKFTDENGQGYLEIIDVKTHQSYKAVTYSKKDDESIRSFFWIDNNHVYLMFRKKRNDKGMIVQIKDKSGKIETTANTIKASGLVLGPVKDEQDKIWLMRTNPEEEELTINAVNVDNLLNNNFSETRTFPFLMEDAIAYMPDADGNIRFAISVNETDVLIWYFDSDNSKWIEFYSINKKSDTFTPLGTLENGKIAVLSNEITDKVAVMEFDINTQRYGEVLFEHEKYDLISAALDSEGELSQVSYFDHGQWKTQYFSDQGIEFSSIFSNKYPQLQHALTSQSPRYAVALAFSSNDPGAFYLIDKHKKKVKELKRLYPNINPAEMIRSKSFRIKSRNQDDLEIIFTPGNKKYHNQTLIVMPHGGPVGARDLAVFDQQTQFLANRGYSVLKVNFSGSSGFGKRHLDKGVAQFGRRIEQDLTDAVQFIESKYNFKYKCAAGASYGGYSAVMLIATHPEEYDCAVAAFGIYDLPMLFNASNWKILEEYRATVEAVVGKESKDLLAYSPVYFANKIQDPILLLAGEEDDRAPIEHSNRMKYVLKKLNKPFEYLFYEKTGHGHPNWYGDWHEALLTDDFLRRTLKIPPIEGNNLDNYIDEIMLLADSFSFEDNVKNDDKKSIYYLRIAAERRHPRALFNLGAHYHRGDGVKKDINQAIRYYKQASDESYSKASYRIYEIYSEGKYVEKNVEQAHKYLKIAGMQGHKEALDLAWERSCSAKTNFFDLQSCFQLTKKLDTKKYEVKIRLMVAGLIEPEQLSKSQRKELFRFLKDTMNVKLERDVQVFVVGEGIQINDNYQSYLSSQAIPDVAMDKDNAYIIEFRILDNEQKKGSASKDVKGQEWHHPVIVSWNILDENETISNDRRISNTKLYIGNDDIKLKYVLTSEKDFVPGKYELKVESLSGKVLLTKQFKLSELPESS